MYRHLRLETEQRTEFDTRLLAQTSDHLFERFESTAAHLSSRTELRNALARYNHGEMTLAELEAFSVPRLQDALAHAPEVAGLVRLDARGQPVFGLLRPIPAELWPLPAAASTTPALSGPVLLDGRPMLLIGMPILSREGQRLGTDIGAFHLDKLSQLLSAVPLHPATHSHLIHLASGRLMHIHASAPGMSEAPAACPLRGLLRDRQGSLDTLRAQPAGPDDRQLAFVSPLSEHPGWAIGLLAERERLYAGARSELLWPLLGILLLTVAGGVLTRFAIRPLSRRIEGQAEGLELAASVFDCSNEGIMLMDAEHHIAELNPAGCHLLRCAPKDIEGRTLCSLLVPDLSQSPLGCESMWAQTVRIGSWQGEVAMQRDDGSTFHAWLSLAAAYDENRAPRHFAALFTDISETKAEEERIRQMAYRDKLTGLPNRALAQDRLQQALRKARRMDSQLAVLFLDLDHFKPVNDTFGHAVGDHLLQAVAASLRGTVREVDTVARLGGDEFLIILEDLASPQAAGRIADKLVETLQSPFQVDGHTLQIGTSIGIALFPEDGEDAASLVRNADAAMYRAKDAGRNRYAFHAGGRRPALSP
ncbi:Cyclic di-GMP phosphodiesterase Gmr [compost metagenome]